MEKQAFESKLAYSSFLSFIDDKKERWPLITKGQNNSIVVFILV